MSVEKFAACCLAAWCLHPGIPATAEVHFDGSVGRVKLPDRPGGYTTIPFSAGTKQGQNLFQSFKSFDVQAGETVVFKDQLPGDVPAGDTVSVANILARVTGGQISTISGTLKSEIPNASLYLLNPKGVVFNHGASLSITGSFFASTADEVKFAGGTLETAGTGPVSGALTMAPTGFGFTNALPGSIVLNDATLQGAPGSTLGLFGRAVSVTGGKLDVPGGQVQLASVSRGTLQARTVAGKTTTQFSAKARGGSAVLDGATIGDKDAPGQEAGLRKVVIRSGTLVLKNRATATARAVEKGDGIFVKAQRGFTASFSTLTTETHGDLRGQDALAISAGSATFKSGATASVRTADGGQGGNLRLTISGRLMAQDQTGASVINSTSAVSGDLIVRAGSADLNGGSLGIFNYKKAPAGAFSVDVAQDLTIRHSGELALLSKGGVMEIEAGTLALSGNSVISFNNFSADRATAKLSLTVRDRLSVVGGAKITGSTIGRAGRDIEIQAGEIYLSGRGADNTATGIIGESDGPAHSRGGTIHLEVSGNMEVLDGATVSSNTLGQGEGGGIQIHACNLLVTGLPGTPGSLQVARGITAKNQGGEGGSSGSIGLRLQTLQVRDGGEIDVSTLGLGHGGSIIVNAGSVRIEGPAARLSAQSGTPQVYSSGAGGSICLTTDRLEIADGGQVTASTYGAGAGGNIEVKTDRLRIRGESADAGLTGITAQTLGPGATGPGGSAEIDAHDILLDGAGATVASSSTSAGNAGSITLHPGQLTLQHGSSIQSASTGFGLAGNIHVDSDREITLRSGSSISVAAPQSSAGNITLATNWSIDLDDSSITGQALLTGGNITLRARDLLFLRDSRITAAAQFAGGNIAIDPRLVVLDHSVLDASADLASGGNIHLQSDFIISPPENRITATSERGIDGEVQIDALHIDLTGSLVALPGRLLEAESLLRELCTIKLDAFSSFVRQGRGGVGPLPGAPLPSMEIIP